jgi:hypothetical protein
MDFVWFIVVHGWFGHKLNYLLNFWKIINTLLGWWTFVQPDYCSPWAAWTQIKLFFFFFFFFEFLKNYQPYRNSLLGWTFVQHAYCSAWAAWAQIKLFLIFLNIWKIINPTRIHFWVEPLYSMLIVVHGRLRHKLNYFLFYQKLSTL